MCYTLHDRDHWLAELAKTEFAHIAVGIAEVWERPEAVEYFKSLLVNQRNQPRRGFPPHAYKIILKLFTIYSFMNESLDEWVTTYFVD